MATTPATFILTNGIRIFLIWEGSPCLWPGEHTSRVRPRSLPAVSSATWAHSVGNTLYFNCFYLLGVFALHCQTGPSPDCHQLVSKLQQSPEEPWSTRSFVSCTAQDFTWQTNTAGHIRHLLHFLLGLEGSLQIPLGLYSIRCPPY